MYAQNGSLVEASIGGSGYATEYTEYTETFKGLYYVTPRNEIQGTLRAFVNDWEWKKCGTGSCTDTVSKTTTTNTLNPIDVTTTRSFLRTSDVYVDKARFYVVFDVSDEYGSPRFATSGSNTMTLAASVGSAVTSLSCKSSTTLGNYESYDGIYDCSGDGSSFSFAGDIPITLTLTATDGTSTCTQPVGSGQCTTSGATNVNVLTLKKKPNWYHSALRADSNSPTSWPTSRATPNRATVLTTPTYPLYNNENFEVRVYNYAPYTSSVTAGGLTVFFDTSVVDYVSFSSNPLFGAFTPTYLLSQGQITWSWTSASVSTMNNFFRYLTITFKVKNGVPTGRTATGIHVNFGELLNTGQNAVTSPHYSDIFDSFLQKQGSATSEVEVDVIGTNHRAMFSKAAQNSYERMGTIYNFGLITGSNTELEHGTPIVTDYMPANQKHIPVTTTTATLTSCTTSGVGFTTAVSGSKCRSTLLLTSAGATGSVSTVVATYTGATCGAQVNGVCTVSPFFYIIAPSVSIHVTDATLNVIQDLQSATCGSGVYPYQTTRVTVLADGSDVTELATNMIISDTAIADFASSYGHHEMGTRIVGKSLGSTVLKLYNDANAPSLTLSVSSVAVNVTSLEFKVITDVDWSTSPPSSYSYPNTFQASVDVHSSFTSRPAGSTRGSYGYIFSFLYWSDGVREDVLSSELSFTNGSPNIFVIPPGGSDTHTGKSALTMYNSNTNRHMITVSKSAYTECIDSSLQATFGRCGVDIATGFPVLHVVMPDPERIRFNISASGPTAPMSDRTLTPSNGGASFAPFVNVDTVATSGFELEVFFDDGTSIDTYAEEDGVVYFSLDETCATVDNTANTVTILENATCTGIVIGVNVTIGDAFFQAYDSAPIVRLASVETRLTAYPTGTSNLNSTSLHPLPCGAGYERFTASSTGTLDDGTTRTYSTSHVTYPPTDPSVLTVVNNLIKNGTTPGTALIGSSYLEFHSSVGGSRLHHL